MKKSKTKVAKSNSATIFKIIVVVLAILSLGMAFAPFVTQNIWAAGEITTTFNLSGFVESFGATATYKSGDNLASWTNFGATIKSIGTDGTTYTIDGNIGNLLATIFLVVGLLFALVSLCCNNKKSIKVGGCLLAIAAIFLLTSGVLSFFSVQFGGFESALTGQETALGNLKTGVEYTLGYGALTSSISAILAALIAGVCSIFAFKK